MYPPPPPPPPPHNTLITSDHVVHDQGVYIVPDLSQPPHDRQIFRVQIDGRHQGYVLTSSYHIYSIEYNIEYNLYIKYTYYYIIYIYIYICRLYICKI